MPKYPPRDKKLKNLWMSKIAINQLKELSVKEKRPEASIVEILIEERFEAVEKSDFKPTEIPS